MAIREITKAEGQQSGGWSSEYGRKNTNRLFVADWATAESEAPQLGDAYPGNDTLKVCRILGEPFGACIDEGPPVVYKQCLVTVEYSTRVLDVLASFRPRIRAGIKVLTLDQGMKWTSNGEPVGLPVNVKIPCMQYELEGTRAGLMDVHAAAALPYIGTINSAPWRGFGAGCVLFEGIEGTQQQDDVVGVQCPLSYQFTIFQRNHNLAIHVFPDQTRIWDTTEPLIYESTDFAGLGAF